MPCTDKGNILYQIYDGVRRASELRTDLVVSVEDLIHIYENKLKNKLRPSRKNSVQVTSILQIVRNPHRILARGSEFIFQWDI